MVTFIFTKHGEQSFLKLSKSVQGRCFERLRELKSHEDIFSVVKRLHHLEPATHRLRIGNYRFILELRTQKKNAVEFWILDTGHRKDIYR